MSQSDRAIVDPEVVRKIDEAIDKYTTDRYKDQPLAQDWARVAKLSEEVGETVSELILWTGQNYRKGEDPAARGRMMTELADVAMAAIYAIQHFTKDVDETRRVMLEAQDKHMSRVPRD